MNDVTDVGAEVPMDAAAEGYVAGTYFARWNPAHDVRALIHVILGGPVDPTVQDFYDGFIAGAEAEQQRRDAPDVPAPPFVVRWSDEVQVRRGETAWIVGPQPGPWRPTRD